MAYAERRACGEGEMAYYKFKQKLCAYPPWIQERTWSPFKKECLFSERPPRLTLPALPSPPFPQAVVSREGQPPWSAEEGACSPPWCQAPVYVFPEVWTLRKDYASFNFSSTQQPLGLRQFDVENKKQRACQIHRGMQRSTEEEEEAPTSSACSLAAC